MNVALRIQDEFIKMPLSSRLSSMEGVWQLGGEGAGEGSASLDSECKYSCLGKERGCCLVLKSCIPDVGIW